MSGLSEHDLCSGRGLTQGRKENSEGGFAGDGENVLKKDYLQGSATAWAPSTDCLALKPLLPEVARPTGHGIQHTFDIDVRVRNADDMVEIKIKCLLIDSKIILNISNQ